MPDPSPSPSPAPTMKGPGDPGMTEEERRSYFMKGYEGGVAAGIKRASRDVDLRDWDIRWRPDPASPWKSLFRPHITAFLLGAIGGLLLGLLLAKALF